MEIGKFRCPVCGGNVYAVDDDDENNKITNTDRLEPPLFAPSWDEEEMWHQDPYYRLTCDKGHQITFFENSQEVMDTDTFRHAIEKKMEEFLYNVILKYPRYTYKGIFAVVDSSDKVLSVSTSEAKAADESKYLNMWLKDENKGRFRVSPATLTIPTQ